MFFKTVFFFLRSPKKINEDLFFPENTWVCVLGPCSLALASSIPVLGLCPWPLALCPRFHL